MNQYGLSFVCVAIALCAGCTGSRTAAVALQEPASASAIQTVGYEVKQPKSVPVQLPVPLEPLAELEDSPFSGISLADVEALALANNPTLGKAQSLVQALRGKREQVGLRPNPTIGYAGSEIGNEGEAGQQGGYISQEFVTADKLDLRQAVVSREIVQANQRLAAQRLRVLTDARSVYYRVLVAQERVEVTANLLKSAEKTAETVRKLLAAEQSTRIVLLQAEVEAESAQISLQNAQNNLDAAWRRLAAVVGMPDLAKSWLTGELTTPPTLADWHSTLGQVVAGSPEFATAMVGIQRARAKLRRECAEAKPNFGVQAGVQYDHATQDTISSVQVSLPLPVFDRNQGSIRQARAEISAASREADRVELDLHARLATAYRQQANAQSQAHRYHESVLPKAAETMRLVTMGYEAGELSYLNLLTAQRTYFQTNLKYLDSLEQAWLAHVHVEGLLLSDSLSAR